MDGLEADPPGLAVDAAADDLDGLAGAGEERAAGRAHLQPADLPAAVTGRASSLLAGSRRSADSAGQDRSGPVGRGPCRAVRAGPATRRPPLHLPRAGIAPHPDAAGGVSAVALSDHPVGVRRALRDARRMDRLTSPPPLEGDIGDIYRKLSFGSSALPNAPKCNRRLIPHTLTRDTTSRMRVPDRVALASASSRAGHRRPFTQRLLGS